FAYYALRGLSLMYLPYSDFSFYGLGLFTMFYGLDWIATVPPTVRLANERFGTQLSPLVYGWIGVGLQAGAAVAAYGAGVLRVQTNRYVEAFLIAGAMCLVAAFLILTIRRKESALELSPCKELRRIYPFGPVARPQAEDRRIQIRRVRCRAQGARRQRRAASR